MYQVYIVSQTGKEFNFGHPVKTLAEATVLADALEWMFTQLLDGDRPDLDWIPALDSLEGSEVYAQDMMGVKWIFIDSWERA